MNNIILTDKQNFIKNEVIKWYKNEKKEKNYLTIGGVAGSGKSTLIKFILKELNIEDHVATVTYTGMASCVLRSKGNMTAQTIHKLIYITKEYVDPDTGESKLLSILKSKEVFFEENEGLQLIVVDEYSMVPDKIVKDLLKFNLPILFTGDRCQLSAIGKQNELTEDYFLDEPLRQALDNPIIYLANLARTGQINKIRPGKYGDTCNVYTWNNFPLESIEEANQVIVCKNKTVQNINFFYRQEILNLEKEANKKILNGDKIMLVERNNWREENTDGFSAVNGLIGYTDNVRINNKYDIYTLDLNPTLPTSKFHNLNIDKAHFEERPLTKMKKLMRNDLENKGINMAIHAYAITCHKSQGSEWDYVTFGPEFLRKDIINNLWYTGITRAKEKLDLII